MGRSDENEAGRFFGRVIVIACTVVALILQVYAARDCEFVTLDNSSGSIGIMNWSLGGGTCRSYQINPQRQAFLYTARVAAYTSIIAAAIGIGFVAFETVVFDHCCFSFFENCAYFLMIIMTGLMYIIFAADYCDGGNCGLGHGGILNIVSFVFYFIATMVLGGPKPIPLLQLCCTR